MASRRGLRLASFDGGGVRSFSQLDIMKAIMHRLRRGKYAGNPDKVMLPCEHFDLIGGSDTGGLIAIMFAKLEMSVEEASMEFSVVVDEVYAPNLDPVERKTRLRKYMEALLNKRMLPLDLKLQDEVQDTQCAGFVVAVPTVNLGDKICLRTYRTRSQNSSSITVIDAVLSTCPSYPLFAPVTVGTGDRKEEFVGASLGGNNPIQQVIKEAHSLFGGDSGVASLLSVGSGHPGVFSLTPNNGGETLHLIAWEMMTDCEQQAQDTQRLIGQAGIYFRFSVEQGMQKDKYIPRQEVGWILAQTNSYLATLEIGGKIDELVHARVGMITLQRLNCPGGPKVMYKGPPVLATHYTRRQIPWAWVTERLNGDISGQRIMVVAGIAGCGKTQLLSDVSQEYDPAGNPRFAYVFFIDGSSDTSIESDLIAHVRLATPGHPSVDLTEALNFFENPANKKSLIIYDNVDDPKINLPPFLPRCNHGVIIVTTRNQLLRKLASEPHLYLELDAMSGDEAVELILRCADRQLPSEGEKRTALLIARKLVCLPVALTQAGCYMSDTGCSCDSYLDLLSEYLAELMEKPSGDRQNCSTFAAFDLIYRRLSAEVQDLVHILSFFHFANFPMVAISHAAECSFRDNPFSFADCGAHFEEAIQMLQKISGGKRFKLTLPSAIQDLQKYSLASFTYTPFTQLLRIHPLIHEWAFARIPQERLAIFQEAACRLLVCCLDAKYVWQYLPAHIDAVLSRPTSTDISMNNRVAFGKILRFAGQLKLAQRILLPIYNALREHPNVDNLHVATAGLELAGAYEDTMLDQMAMLGQEAVDIRTARLGPRHLDTIQAKGEYSATLSRQGKCDEALKLKEEVLCGLRRHLPPRHPDILKAMDSLAWAYRRLNNLCKAETIQYQVMQDQIKRVGENHVDTFDAMHKLALTYHDEGRYSEAETFQVKVLEGWKDKMGEGHLYTLSAMHNLALTYHSEGRYSEAGHLHCRVVEGWKTQLGEGHFLTLSAMYDQALTYHSEGRYSEAEILHIEVVGSQKARLGEEHLDTLMAISSLASAYYFQGRYSEAEPLQVNVLEGREAQLGSENFWTLVAAQELAITYYTQLRHTEAEALCKKFEGEDFHVLAAWACNFDGNADTAGHLNYARNVAVKAERAERKLVGDWRVPAITSRLTSSSVSSQR